MRDGFLGKAVSGMNCPKCGAVLPAEAAYCPSCGTPRSEIDHLLRQAERAVNKALVVGTTVLDRAAKELQPAFDKAVQTLRPAVEAVGKATNDMVVAVTPAGQAPVREAKEILGKTLPAGRPAVHEADRETRQAGHKDPERGR